MPRTPLSVSGFSLGDYHGRLHNRNLPTQIAHPSLLRHLLRATAVLRFALQTLKTQLGPKPPKHVVARYRKLTPEQQQALRAQLAQHYFADAGPEYLNSEAGRHDMANHLHGRVEHDRRTVIPWLDALRPLNGCRVLEIGCGTGCSTVALAEQGAAVVGVDVSERSLRVAEARCAAHGVSAELVHANVVDLDSHLSTRRFDLVIFYASLEHMTYDERLVGIRTTWDRIGPDGLWCVIETPNRLWYEDGHTSLLPFYLWLPDELALAYSRFSPRPGFQHRYRELSDEQLLRFRREGRGVSYHEWELALDRPANELRVVSSLETHYRSIRWLRALRRPQPRELRYAKLLRSLRPDLHPGFFMPQLDMVFTK